MLTRRRFLGITASVAALPPLMTSGLARAGGTVRGMSPVVWRGTAMGAMASMTLVHPDRAEGQRLIEQCRAEIDRLENIFSLYRSDSAITRLNREGVLESPPHELVEVLSFSQALARASDGAFDPTIQPLFQLYMNHFRDPGSVSQPPPRARIAEALARVDYRQIRIGGERIELGRGMAITLNGVAQGYVTDRVAALLRSQGLEHLLLDLGELHANGNHVEGRPWHAGIADSRNPGQLLMELDLPLGPERLPALATSAAAGSRFEQTGQWHHLLDPKSGESSAYHSSVSVAARNALVADGLSTALSLVPAGKQDALLAAYAPAQAFFVSPEGELSRSGLS